MRLTRAGEWPDALGERIAHAPVGDLWAVGSASELRVFEDGRLAVGAGSPGDLLGELGFSPDGAHVLAAPLRFDRAAAAWEPRPPTTEALGLAVTAAVWSPDGDALLLYGEDRPPRGRPRAYDGPGARVVLLDGERTIPIWEGDADEPRGALLAGREIVAIGGRRIDVRDRRTARPIRTLEPFPTVARTLRLGDAHFAAAFADGQVAVWDAASWTQIGCWRAHPDEARGLAFGATGLATGGSDGAVRLWTLDGRCEAEVELGEAAPVTGLAFRPDGRSLLAARAGLDGGVAALELRS